MKHFLINKFNTLYNIYALRKSSVRIKSYTINGRIKIINEGNINIGENLKINSGLKYNPIGGDSKAYLIARKEGELKIGENFGFSNSTIVCTKKIEIGKNVLIGGSCKIWDTDFHDLNYLHRRCKNELVNSKAIYIGDDVFIGSSTIVLKGVNIGCRAVIGAGSVVSKDIPEDELWAGNPIKFIKKLNFT